MHRPVERYNSATLGVTDQSVNFGWKYHISFGMIVLQKSKYTAGGQRICIWKYLFANFRAEFGTFPRNNVIYLFLFIL